MAETLDSVTTSPLAAFELQTTFARLEATGVLPEGGATDRLSRWRAHLAAGTVALVQPTATVLTHEFAAVLTACFSRRPPTFIRTNDALHLAAARVMSETQFIAADARQAEAARLLGFAVLP